MLEGVTLDQLRMLVAIADAGSFTAAAKKVQRAQSAVSHAIAGLENQLQLQLFDRSTKKPTLTPAGETIVAEARGVVVRAERLKATARNIALGLESEIVVASGVIVPQEALVSAFKDFNAEFPSVAVTFFREEIAGPVDLVSQGKADLCFDGKLSLALYDEDVFEKTSIGTADVVSVAHPEHPLAQLGRSLSDADLADHRQLVPTSRVLPRYDHTLVHDTWAMADVRLRLDLIRQGVGWGTVPLAMADPYLKDGSVVELVLEARSREALQVPLYAIWRTDSTPGPAQRSLIDTLRTALA